MYRNYMCAALLFLSSVACYGGWRDCFPCCGRRQQEFPELGQRFEPDHASDDSDQSGNDSDIAGVTIISADGLERLFISDELLADHDGDLQAAAAATARLAATIAQES